MNTTLKDNNAIVPERTLIPDYLSTDFETFVARQIEVLKKTEQFKDYNFEGSNIRLLMEWFGYISELNTFYLNKIAKNVYDDTVDMYENSHRISTLKGYNPRGYISSSAEVEITVKVYDDKLRVNFLPGDQLYIPAGKYIFAKITDDNKNSYNLPFIVNDSLTIDIPNDPDIVVNGFYTFKIPLIQGTRVNYTYKGSELIDNKIILPFYNFNHDALDSDTKSTIHVSIDNEKWVRVDNFLNFMSNLYENNKTDNVFKVNYDKYKRYILEFSTFRSVPSPLSEIKISLLVSDGSLGNIGSNLINLLTEKESTGIVYNNTKRVEIPLSSITVTNSLPSQGGCEPQTIEEITNISKGFMNSQERLVTKYDYITFLKSRSDIITANAWGEKEISYKGNTSLYNKVHISCIPSTWNSNTIEVSGIDWTIDTNSTEIYKPIKFSDNFKEDLKTYLEPRKILTTYESFELPELIYFAFRIDLRIKRLYNFPDVAETVKSKLDYYFKAKNRNFGEKVSFMDIHNYLLNISQKADGYNWDLIKGVDNIIFREISIFNEPISQEKIDFYSVPVSGGSYINEKGEEIIVDRGYGVTIKPGSNIYPPNNEYDYPKYLKNEYMDNIENRLKVIELSHNQFPLLATDLCIIQEERG